jgi:hypothetical protein
MYVPIIIILESFFDSHCEKINVSKSVRVHAPRQNRPKLWNRADRPI